VVDVGAGKARVGEAGHVTLGDVLGLWKQKHNAGTCTLSLTGAWICTDGWTSCCLMSQVQLRRASYVCVV
jgi:hypothetical protein